jgi:hypothetical protein
MVRIDRRFDQFFVIVPPFASQKRRHVSADRLGWYLS